MRIGPAAVTLGKIRRMPTVVVVRWFVRLIPFRPVDVAKLRFLMLDAVPVVPPAMMRGRVAVRRGSESDLDGLTALQDKRAIFESRLAEGDHCAVAIANGRIVGYEWFCDHAVHRESEWNYPIAIPPGSVYAYDAYVDPAYRNGGVWLRFKAYLAEWMTARQKRQVITFVEAGNTASWRTHIRFGFRPTNTVLALRVFGLTMFRLRAAR